MEGQVPTQRLWKVKARAKGGREGKNSDFICSHCHAFVSSAPALSGVNHRNHCPYCLWSRHLDLFEAGDRLAACKARMEPVGLALKRTRKKYGTGQSELMLVHRCLDCGKVSANRIAADDLPDEIYRVYRISLKSALAEAEVVSVLNEMHEPVVRAQLFGRG